MAELKESKLDTEYGTLHVVDSGAVHLRPAVLMIHGNSSCHKIFRNQFQNPALYTKHRMIAFDYPGHGASRNAPDPEKSYTMGGYAQAAVEVLKHLGVSDVIVLGWSLGGHVAIEMVPIWSGLKGIMIVGTPPGAGQGFHGSDHMGAAEATELSEKEIDEFAHAMIKGPHEPWLRETVARTDGQSRTIMFHGFRTGGVDQREVVAESDVLCAVVNGADEPYVDLDYCDKLTYKNLWDGKCHKLKGLQHAPFWEEPETFNPLFERFVEDASRA